MPPTGPALVGSWDPVFYLPNVAIHTHVLPNGKVLFWGRRDRPDASMDEHECTPFLWDPEGRTFSATPQPALDDQTKVNLFCSGHAFLPNGELLVAGGHLQDGHGDNQACVYDYRGNTWTALPRMDNGRWYPSALTLPDGTVLVDSGSYFDGIRATPNNAAPQVWTGRGWRTLEDKILSLYPRWHVLPDGVVFITGTNAESFYLDPHLGKWRLAPSRSQGARDYAPSVMYDVGKIVYIGGGNDARTNLPTDEVETIDCTLPEDERQWRPAARMHHPRRHHNATILPDGTILVTGGTQGKDFNDLSPGQPVHIPELWDPVTNTWAALSAEATDRCYHGTAVLLPDATVLSAGSGEGGSDPNVSHREAQIFRPPYLFRGPQPKILSGPATISYAEEFSITVSGEVGQVTWIRLGSVTHAFNQNQRINFLEFQRAKNVLSILAPARPELCPPGHYMLFVLNRSGVPSHAHMVQIVEAGNAYELANPSEWIEHRSEDSGAHYNRRLRERDRAIRHEMKGTRVAVGLTSRCPYGLGACWGAAYEALQRLDGVEAVRPIPNTEHSTADVYLQHRGLPALDRWPEQFSESAKGSYHFRGVEISIDGNVHEHNGKLQLTGPDLQAIVDLRPLSEGTKIEWDHKARKLRDASPDEVHAYLNLTRAYQERGRGDQAVHITGPLQKSDDRWTLYVRRFHW
jgi:galactose oxidase